MSNTQDFVKTWLKAKGWNTQDRDPYTGFNGGKVYKRYGFPIDINEAATYEMVKDIIGE